MQLSPFCFNNVEDIVDRGWIVLEYTRLEDILDDMDNLKILTFFGMNSKVERDQVIYGNLRLCL